MCWRCPACKEVTNSEAFYLPKEGTATSDFLAGHWRPKKNWQGYNFVFAFYLQPAVIQNFVFLSSILQSHWHEATSFVPSLLDSKEHIVIRRLGFCFCVLFEFIDSLPYILSPMLFSGGPHVLSLISRITDPVRAENLLNCFKMPKYLSIWFCLFCANKCWGISFYGAQQKK